MALYAIKSTIISTDKEKGINDYDTEILPFVYKSYTSAVEGIKGFVNRHIKEDGYKAINELSCVKDGKYLTFTQDYQVTELIEME